MMKTVITYGTFDLLHYGHTRLLQRAKALGDRLIVGVTSDAYDKERGKLNVQESLLQRIKNIQKTGLADEILVEEYEGQKIIDIQKYSVDVFAIGSDWTGKFDYLKSYCDVVYLERTKGISSTQLRTKGNSLINLGVIGSGRIAKRFIKESKYVSGINIEGVYNPNMASAKRFAEDQELNLYTDQLEELFSKVDAIYIASPHSTHYSYIISALNAGLHVLCEKPMTLSESEAAGAFKLAKKKHLILLHAVKTAYCPAFEHLLLLAKSGRIGEIKDVEASFTKIVEGDVRELNPAMSGGSMNELATYPLLPIFKLLGTEYTKIDFYSYIKDDVDLFTKGIIQYKNATGSFKVGLGVKTEGEMIITGTRGYLYVPAPWWKTDYFEMRFEDLRATNKYFYKFEGDGLRYELMEFVSLINGRETLYRHLREDETIAMSRVLETYHNNSASRFEI